MKDLMQRTLINGLSAIFIALFIFLAEFGPFCWLFTLVTAAIAAIALWEYNQLLKKKNLRPAAFLNIFAVVLYIFANFLEIRQIHFIVPELPFVVLLLAGLGCFVYFVIVNKSAIENIASTLFGILYIGVPLGLIIRIMFFFTSVEDHLLQGSWWVIYLIATTKSSDIGGYFVGSYFGKHKLAVKISPKKTVEGSFGGLLAAALVSFLICFLGKNLGHVFSSFSYTQSIWLGLVVAILSQAGDLAESLLKRDAGVKDSNSFPGVGGILDMIDSLLFTAPLIYIFVLVAYS